MDRRILSLLLILQSFVIPIPAQAQMTQPQQWGTGLYGAGQSCNYPNAQAPALQAREDDEIEELKHEQQALKTEKRESAKQLRALEAKKTKHEDAIALHLKGDWASAVTSHLENGGSCGCQSTESETFIRPHREVPPSEFQPPQFQPPTPSGNRAPSSVVNSLDLGFSPMGGSGERGSPHAAASCRPGDHLSTSIAWRSVCRDGGSVAKEICRNSFFRNAESGGRSAPGAAKGCEDAISNYRKVILQIAKIGSRMSRTEERLTEIATRIRERKRELKEDPELMEASRKRPGQQPGQRPGQPSGSGTSFMPLLAGVAAGLGAEYMGYRSNKQNNESLNKMGWPTQSYQAGSYGYPFLQAGIYGSIASGQTGAFGCATGMNGGGQLNGAGGMINGLSAQGMMNPSFMNGSFGYPGQGLGISNSLGGGMYSPGASGSMMMGQGLAYGTGYGYGSNGSINPLFTNGFNSNFNSGFNSGINSGFTSGLNLGTGNVGLNYNPSLDLRSRSYGSQSGGYAQQNWISEYTSLMNRINLMNSGSVGSYPATSYGR